MSGTGGRKMEQVQPTEEPVKEVVKEEMEAAKSPQKTSKKRPFGLKERI